MPIRLRRRTGLLVAVLALASALAAPGPAGAGTSSPDVLTLQGGDGYLMGLRSAAYTGTQQVGVHLLPGGRDQVQVSAGTGTSNTHLQLGGPVGSPALSVGRHPAARFADEATVQLDIGTEARGCNSSTGWVDVLALSRGADGRLTSLAVDYSHTCDAETAATTGSLRWNTDVPYAFTTTTAFAAPVTGPGAVARGRIQVTNSGSAPQVLSPSTFEASRWEERPQLPVEVEEDLCAGTTLAPGASCSVGVAIPSDGLGLVNGHLRTPDSTLRTASYSPVTMHVSQTPQAVTVRAEPARGGVRLTTSGYNPSYSVRRAEILWNGTTTSERVVGDHVTMPWTDTSALEGTRYRYRVVPYWHGVFGSVSPASTAGPLPVPTGAEGTFTAVSPRRVLDTRYGTGAPRRPLGQGQTLTFDPAAAGGLPRSGVSAVLLNVTGTQPTRGTYLTVWPSGHLRPSTSSVNLAPGQTRPNHVVVPVGEDGRVSLFNYAGTTQLVVDLQGYYADESGTRGGGYHTVEPARLLDTRLTMGAVAAGQTIWVPVTAEGLDGRAVAAVDVNLTVTRPTRGGHLTAWSGSAPAPTTSNVNYGANHTVANHAVVPVSLDPAGLPGIAVRTSAGSTHLVVDLQGWYDSDADTSEGLRFRPVPARRLLDTRTAGPRTPANGMAVLPGASLPTAVAHVVNLTAVGPLGSGHLTTWSGDGVVPRTSSLNFVRGETAPNLAVVATGAGGPFAVTVRGSDVHLLVDHLGYFY